MPDAQLVFLAPPSVEELHRRLVGRGTDDADTIRRRLAHADEELAAEKEFDRDGGQRLRRAGRGRAGRIARFVLS